MRQEGEGHSKNVHVLRVEESSFGVKFVGGATKPAADNLLTQELAREGSQAHDVRYRFSVPSLREHSDRNHALNLLTGLADRPHGIDLQT